MERPFVGDVVRLDITFPEFKDVSDNILPISGATAYVERVNGTERIAATISPTSDPRKYKAVVTLSASGAWEAQARCTSPEVWHSPRVKFEVVQPLNFTP